ncbi:MAG: AraC family transcriptional regulator [Ferruginibacter sp.]
MINLHSSIKNNNSFRKMEVSDLLFAEYSCMQEETTFRVWSNNNYFAFISSGKKMYKSIYHSYELNEGDVFFVKKGAILTPQFFDDEFCAIVIFISDDFIKAFLKKNAALCDASHKDISTQDVVLRIQHDQLLESYYQSIQSYLSLTEKPNEHLLILKVEELLLSLFSSKKHQQLTDYFISLCQNQQFHMSRIMEENFAYNLNLENCAQLCHMSLSTFKKSFRQFYHTTPGAWLKSKKLELTLHQLLSSDLSVKRISFECGFKNTSHFIRAFKEKYKLTPMQYRQNYSEMAPWRVKL